MAQRTTYIYRLLTWPRFYAGFQKMLGADRSQVIFVQEVAQPTRGMKVLDVGCGPASLFAYLGEVDYTGIDLNPHHIAHAKSLWGNGGRFLLGDATTDLVAEPESYELVIVAGLLHHLDDNAARRMFIELARLGRPGARIVTIDPVWLPNQNPAVRLMNKLDSGLNIRTAEGYLHLVEGLPLKVEGRVFRNLLRIPYDHFCMTLVKPKHKSDSQI